jgi:glycosyltransferase involved in cell wall biosynthesis
MMPNPDTPKRPLVTVLMSVYNGARFLEEAVESIRNQTFSDFEFLIIDDGSNDASPAILARQAVADRRIRILTQENRGLIVSLNRGFGEARGELVARMDADDIARPRRLESQVAFLEAHKDITVLGGCADVIDVNGRRSQTVRFPERPDQIRRHMRELGCAVAHPTVLFRLKAVRDAGGLRRAYRHAEDYDLWLRMVETCDFANLPDIVLSYRRHQGSVSIRHPRQQALSAICARYTAKLRLEGVPDPTSGVALITTEVILGLGISRETLNADMVNGLRETTWTAITEGRR